MLLIFINADKYPFEEELIVKDKFYDCLCIQDEKIDVIAVQVAQNLFTSYYKILNAAMKEQLPGGAFYTLNSKKNHRNIIGYSPQQASRESLRNVGFPD